jgi:hypothetical protein
MNKPTPRTDKILYAHDFVPGDLMDHALRLEEENAELLEALKEAEQYLSMICEVICVSNPPPDGIPLLNRLRTIIAKGESP